jgi:four helix bundle protein
MIILRFDQRTARFECHSKQIITMKRITSLEDIACWQKARNMVNRIYKICNQNSFKKDNILTEQTKKTAISIMTYIAEGYTRNNNREFIQHLVIAKASAADLQNHLYIAHDLSYLHEDDFIELTTDIKNIQRKISQLIKFLRISSLPVQQIQSNRVN